MEIIQNVHRIPYVIANAYVIIDPHGLTVIDSGLPGSAKKILKYIINLGYAPSDIKRILITHADFDHIGGLAALKKNSGARVFASQIEAPAIGIGRSSRTLKPEKWFLKIVYALVNRYAKATPVKVDGFLVAGQILDILGGLQVVDTAGHTPGHISFFAPAASIVFVGDSIISDKKGLIPAVKDTLWDHPRAMAAVRAQAALGASIVCSGHGPVIKDAVGKYPQV